MVIPIYDDNPTRRTPVVTYALLLLNLFVFIFLEPINHSPLAATTQLQACKQEAFFDRYAAIPDELTTGHQLHHPVEVVDIAPGLKQCGPVARPTYHKSPWLSVLFSMFLHGGWLHVLGNMLFLWVFGNNVEDRLGRIRFLLFYLFIGYVSAFGFAYANANSTQTLIGASGAIAGVLGSYLLLYPRARVTSLIPFFFFIPARIPAWLVLGGWFVLQYIYANGTGVASGGGVAYLAHVIGFVTGMLLTLPLLRRRPRQVT